MADQPGDLGAARSAGNGVEAMAEAIGIAGLAAAAAGRQALRLADMGERASRRTSD